MDSAEIEDDKMIVVIVGEGDEILWNNDDKEMCKPIKVKEEPMNEQEILDTITAAEVHGEIIKLEFEEEEHYAQSDNEFEDESYEQTYTDINQDFLNEVGESWKEEELDDNDDEYVPNEDSAEDTDDEVQDDWETVKKYKRPHNRHSMVPPAQRKSFIDDLRLQYQELKEDEDLLISTVAEIMRNIKTPKVPNNVYYLSGPVYICKICEAITPGEPAAGRHWIEQHGPRYLVCFACGVDFRSKTNLYKHEKRCVALPDARIVLKARALFLGRKGRGRPYMPDLSRIPLLKPKYSYRYSCAECSATYTSKAALTAHEHLHRGERPYWCDKCPSGYTSLSALTRHQQTHSDQRFICDTCRREFKVKAALVAHMNTHNPVPKFACKYDNCPRRFATKNALNHHVRREHLHLPMPCACQICPARYPRMSLLRDHMRKAHGMALMTRKMFFKALPRLTEAQIKQAQVILKGETPTLNLSADLEQMQSNPWQDSEYILEDL